VPGKWPLVARDREVVQMMAALRDTRKAVVLSGRAGVGKTRLLSEFVTSAERRGFETAPLTATRAAARTPLGVFAGLAVGALPAQSAGGGREEPDAMLRHLLRFAQEKPTLLAVDDAHLLDEVSAAVVGQLARSPHLLVAVSILVPGRVSDAIHALTRDDLAVRLPLGPLDVDAVGSVLEAALGSPVDQSTVADLAQRCAGDLHVLRELVDGAMADGHLVRANDVWLMTGQPVPSERLVEFIEARLGWLSAKEREVLEVVAFADMVTAGELAAVSDVEAAEALEAAGLISVVPRDRRLELRVVSPVVRDVVRLGTPLLRRHRLAATLEAALREGSPTEADVLRVAQWHLDSETVSEPAEVLAAATIAQRDGRFADAERFARAAARVGGGFAAELLAAQLASLQGRAAESERELEALFRRASSESERAAVTATRVHNQLFHVGLGHDAVELTRERDDIEDPEWRGAAAAARAGIVLNAEGPGAAAVAATPLLATVGGQALILARLVASYSAGRMGDLDASIRFALDGERALVDFSGPTVGLPFLHVFHRCDALVFRGDIVVAERLAEERYAEAIAAHAPEQQCIFAFQLAKSVGDRGHLPDAIRFGREAVALFEELGRPRYQAWCLQYLALAYALGGDAKRAKTALQRHDALDPTPDMVMAVDLLVARGWAATAEGNLPDSARYLEEGAALGERIGDRVGALAALHSLARLGRAAPVLDRLRETAEQVEGPLAQARVAHAEALIQTDADALVEVSDRFGEMGADLLAAEAAADAAVALRRAGRSRRAAGLQQRAGRIAERCGGARTPALHTVAARVVLTDSERATAVLAAQGRSSPAIAAELGISVRTVEGRLQRAYEKLDVHSRDALAEVLDLGETSDARNPAGVRNPAR